MLRITKEFINNNILYIAWLQALAGVLLSLYFSEMMKLPPCNLCWYQRIALYPLGIIMTVGIIKEDKNLSSYVLPLSISGMIIAIYHNLLYYSVIPESISPCTIGASCTTKQIEWLGFITIPLMSFVAFTLITICILVYRKSQHGKESS